ncbi:hypothetical protein WAC35_29015, partial [Klebsiella pneumoniae]|uniref:hypothetical protein n=1 Tax=Klebsiella pneumoniae TaxID=573 RepID=UPI003012ADAF
TEWKAALSSLFTDPDMRSKPMQGLHHARLGFKCKPSQASNTAHDGKVQPVKVRSKSNHICAGSQ